MGFFKKTNKYGLSGKSIPTESDYEIIYSRFANNSFVSMIIQDISKNNFECYDYNHFGIRICKTRLTTRNKTYLYSDYGLSDLDLESCRMLAHYIGSILPVGMQYTVRPIYIPNSSDEYLHDDIHDGYMVFNTATRNSKNNW